MIVAVVVLGVIVLVVVIFQAGLPPRLAPGEKALRILQADQDPAAARALKQTTQAALQRAVEGLGIAGVDRALRGQPEAQAWAAGRPGDALAQLRRRVAQEAHDRDQTRGDLRPLGRPDRVAPLVQIDRQSDALGQDQRQQEQRDHLTREALRHQGLKLAPDHDGSTSAAKV